MKKSLSNNKGYSLVELVIVLAIMSVLGATVTFSYKMVANKSATQCAKNVQLAIEKDRLNAMGRNNARMTIYDAGDSGIFMCEETNYGLASALSVTNKIGKKDIDIYYMVGGTKVALDANGLTFEFDRSDGRLKSVKDVSNGELLTSSTDKFVVYVERYSRKYTVTVEVLTGRVVMN